MKRILILANFDVGLYKFRKELIQKLLDEGNEVIIALPYGALVDELVKMGCQFVDTALERRGKNPFADFKLICIYNQLLKKYKPDLVITYTIKPNIYGGMMCRLAHIPYVTNITGLGTAFQKEGLFKKMIVKLYQLALRKAQYIFFENEGNKALFETLQIASKDQTVRLNGAGVNLKEYPFKPLPLKAPIHFLFIGRVMKEKGIDEFFEAAEHFKALGKEVVFDIVGPLEDQYEERIKVLEQKGVVCFYGYQKDVKPFIEKAECFVLPSYHEGMANTLLECAAMGRLLITSNIYGCKEAVNGNGYLIPVADSTALIDAINKFLALTNEEKLKMSKMSRVHMEAVFSKEAVVAETIKYLNKILK